jgi:hypothetical protein
MSAELETHGREHLTREFVFASRREAPIQGRAEDGGRRGTLPPWWAAASHEGHEVGCEGGADKTEPSDSDEIL